MLLESHTTREPAHAIQLNQLKFRCPFVLHSKRFHSPILSELFDSWLELSLVKCVVVDRADPQHFDPRNSRRSTIHQRSTDRAEVVRHFETGLDSLGLRVAGELVFSTKVFDTGVRNDEI